jgi:predicted Zn finger-like uncharacterized protein
MSLATRCTECHTVFRVVQDQLKVSEGWVRCGRCQGVFNALEGLFDIEPEPVEREPSAAPPETIEGASAETAPTEPAVSEPVPAEPALAEKTAEPAAAAQVFAEVHEPSFEGLHEVAADEFETTPASRVLARDRIEFADAEFNIALLAEAGLEASQELVDPSVEAAPTVAPPPPEFLRQAERQARWRRPRTVVALSLLAGLLVLALSLQAALQFRDLLAALSPQAQSALQALCDLAACRIEPLRRIDDIVIESSSLTSAASGDAVRLSVVLRNRGPLPLAMPAVELTLTDLAGKMLARRVLLPSDFGAAQPTLPATSESSLQLVLSTGSRRASGYTVEPFYP